MCQSVGGELRQLAHLLVASLKAAGMRCETLRLPGPFSPTASISESCWVLFSALDTSCHSSSRMAWGHRAYPPGACAYKCVDNDPLTALISNGWGETAHVEQWCTFGLCAQRRACVCVCARKTSLHPTSNTNTPAGAPCAQEGRPWPPPRRWPAPCLPGRPKGAPAAGVEPTCHSNRPCKRKAINGKHIFALSAHTSRSGANSLLRLALHAQTWGYWSRGCLTVHQHPIVLSQSLWMFSVWLVFTSNLNSRTTWLKVKSCNLVHQHVWL